MPRRVKTPPRHNPPRPSANDGQRAGPSRLQPPQADWQQAGPSGVRSRRGRRRSFSLPRASSTAYSWSSSSSDDQSYQSPRMSRSRSEQRRTCQGAGVLRQITRLQLTTDLQIPKLPFARVIREVLQQYSRHNLRITPEALQCLQESAEIYLVQMFEDAYRCTIHRDRVTLMPKDMNLALYLRERWER